MNLRDLLPPGAEMDMRFDALPIAGITADSRMVKPGFLFAAVPGTKADGLAFAPPALAAGAVAVMAERGPDLAGRRCLRASCAMCARHWRAPQRISFRASRRR